MSNNRVEVLRMINSNYIKYENLTQITNEGLQNCNASVAYFYIDLNSVLKTLYPENVMIEDYRAITSCLINMCAHYREYYWTRHKVDTVFFLIYSDNTPYYNNMMYPGYNVSMAMTIKNNRLKYDMINHNFNLLKLLCPYLPDIFFINRSEEVGVIIYDLMSKYDLNNEKAHIILTKDVYNYQLVTLKPNTIILRPKKNKGEDLSYYISINNVLEYYLSKRNVKKRSDMLSPNLLSLIMAMNNLPERNIDTMLNITKTINYLEEMISNNLMINGYNTDILYIGNHICKNEIGFSSMILNNRFKAIDIVSQQLLYMTTNKSYKEIVNLNDPNTVRQINNEYFVENPLDLNRL